MSKHGYVTPGGLLVSLEIVDHGHVANVDAVYVAVEIDIGGSTSTIEVHFPTPPIIDHNAREHFGRPFDDDFARSLAILAVLHGLDLDPDLAGGSRMVSFGPDDLYGLLQRRKLSDKELRRYVALTLYSAYAAETLSVMVQFDDMDKLITGNSELDFVRAVQLLDAEGYAVAHLAMGPTLSGVNPTAKLVREVERWGAPKEDISPNEEYAQQLEAYAPLRAISKSLLDERARYLAARSLSELESVFRATAPIVEGLARDLLRAHGSNRDLPTLGPIISELQGRGLGTIALVSQLNHVLKFGRDLSEHGHAVSEPVLRIACENAFDLAPQLGSLFPRTV